MEPCGNPAFADVTYQFGGNWVTAGEVSADGTPGLFQVPGANLGIGTGTGLYISVSVSGNAAGLSVSAHLSACVGNRCDGAISTIALANLATAFGFPIALFEYNNLELEFISCPPASSSSDSIILIAAAAGAAVLVGTAAATRLSKNKKKVQKSGTSSIPSAGSAGSVAKAQQATDENTV